ncbi:MAG: FecR domain-containing protein [Polyangiaceae bacterium]|jgi:TolA-binding protein
MRSDDSSARLSDRVAGLAELARDSLGEMTERQRIRGLEALRARISDQRRSIWDVRRSALALAGGLVLVGCVALGVSIADHRREHAAGLALRVQGGELLDGGTIHASENARPLLRFSDGSEVALGEGAHVRVRSIDAHGARVTLQDGDAHVYVVHASGTRWAFDAGPFVVNVTGTAFGLSWREDTQQLDLRLENGTVTVSGPASDAPLALRAGQWLTVRGGDVLIRSLTADEADVSSTEKGAGVKPPSEELAANAPSVAGHDVGEPAGARRAAPRRASAHHWVEDLANGRFEAIVSQAVALGTETAIAESSADELAALADAARYTRRQDIAHSALIGLRRRFPASEHANVAAFHLGRMSEADGDTRTAFSWFDTCLGEDPNGAYASEALGRKMTLVQLLEGKQAARAVAEAYLRRFPGGTYAATARALTNAP